MFENISISASTYCNLEFKIRLNGYIDFSIQLYQLTFSAIFNLLKISSKKIESFEFLFHQKQMDTFLWFQTPNINGGDFHCMYKEQ